MKRVLSLILTLSMVLSLMAGICVSVGAEEYTYMQGASITGTAIPELAVGDTLPDLSYEVPAGANYAVTVAAWYKDGNTAAAGDVVENGHAYKLQIKVVANDGYAFDQNDCPLLINGDESAFLAADPRGEDGFGECSFTKDYSFQEAIDKAEASYDAPEVGKPLGEATIPDGVNYTVMTDWYDRSRNESVAVGTTAVEGGCYAIQIRLFPVTGYEFTEDTEFWLNGELNDGADIDFDMINYWSDNYNFGKPVDSVSFTHAEPELGKALPVPTVTGDNCELEYYHWYDTVLDDLAPADAVVEKGHKYELLVIAKPAVGYQFTQETKVTVNGVQSDDVVIGDDSVHYYSQGYDFTVKLTEVSLTCAEPEVGKDFPQIQVPADAGYVASVTWRDEYTWDEVTGKVKDGGRYEAYIYIEPKEGYIFSREDTVVTFNGEQVERYLSVYEDEIDLYRYYSFAQAVDKFEVSYQEPQIGKAVGDITIPQGANYYLSEDSGWYEYGTGDKATGTFKDGERYELRLELKLNFGYETAGELAVYENGQKTNKFSDWETSVYLHREFTFADPIAKVELPAWPELKVGDKLPQISGEGEHYSYYLEWEGYDADGNYLGGDTVEDGALYYACMYADAEAGYEFVDETQVTLGGKPLSNLSRKYYSYIVDQMVYSFGAVKILDKVELTTDIPGYGEKGGEVKIPETAEYSLGEVLWGVSTKDDYEDADVATKAYQYGDRVLLVVELIADEGCIFAPNVTVTINGKEYEAIGIEQWESGVSAYYDLGKITKPGATPPTGDTTPVALLSLLCLSAVMGMGVLLNKKRIVR